MLIHSAKLGSVLTQCKLVHCFYLPVLLPSLRILQGGRRLPEPPAQGVLQPRHLPSRGGLRKHHHGKTAGEQTAAATAAWLSMANWQVSV
jgi:hypothetical protein